MVQCPFNTGNKIRRYYDTLSLDDGLLPLVDQYHIHKIENHG